MASLAPYLPPHLVASLATNGPPKRLPHVERFRAALLFSDISGFTALTERLQARGRDGAEEIATTINAAFAPAIRAIEKEGGSIVSFGGDALFAIFPGATPVHRAQVAAEAIREAFAKRGEITTSAGPAKLGISQAVHHGQVVGLHLGTTERRHYLVGGPAVRALATLEARASGGKLLLSSEARARLKQQRPTHRAAGGSPRSKAAALRPYIEPRLLPLLGKFEGEYRRVVVLFLETKVVRPSALQPFYLALADALRRTEGVLLKTDLSAAGTKWICVFGMPQAHEEDPDRAARVAIEVVEEAPHGLVVRGGLHAGVVANIIVGSRTRRSLDIMGDVVNTTARAGGQAKWDEVLVTEDTRRLLVGVDTKSRGARAVKGKASPVALHALTAARPIMKQVRVSAPMIGRDAELRQIVEGLDRAKAGQGCVIGVKGEPGIGKSRLKYEAAKVAREMGFEVHEGRAVSFGGMAYWTIATLLKDALGLPEVPGTDEVLSKVSEAAERVGMKPVDRHHLADVLGARYPDSPIGHLQPKDMRRNAMIAIRAYCQATANEKPRLFVLEDMHWSDEMSQEAVQEMARALASSRVVLLLLYRSGYRPPAEAQEMTLAELSSEAVGVMLETLLGQVPAAVAALVRDRAEGNPFYVEEVVRHLLEAKILGGDRGRYEILREPTEEDLPGSIELLLKVRLDDLAPRVKRVVEYCAVIGRTFSLDLLARLPSIGGLVVTSIDDLAARELVLGATEGSQRHYSFKHVLIRDVVYASVLASRRRWIHRDVADALEGSLGGEVDAFLALLGHHRERAGQGKEARAHYLAGARRAATQYAHAEAERLFRAYLRLRERPSAEGVRARNELAWKVYLLRGQVGEAEAELREGLREADLIQDRKARSEMLVALAHVSRMTGRIEDAWSFYQESLAIVREGGLRREEGIALSGLANLVAGQEQWEEAFELYQQALAIHQEGGERLLAGRVLGNLAIVYQKRGQADAARQLYERSIATHREAGDRQSEGVVLCNLGNFLSDLGRDGEAQERYEEAIGIFREIGDRGNEGFVLGNIAILLQQHGRNEEAQALYEQAYSIHGEIGDRRLKGQVAGNLGTLRSELGRMDEAHALYEEARGLSHSVRDTYSEAVVLAHIAAWELLVSGDLGRAEALAREGEALLAEIGNDPWRKRLTCLRGHIALAGGEDARALLQAASDSPPDLRHDPEFAGSLDKLRRAQAAFETGEPLLCGMHAVDLTAGQLRWLREHRPDVIPPQVMARLNEDGTLRPEVPVSSSETTNLRASCS